MKTANLAIVFTDIKGFTERTSRQTLEQNQTLLRTQTPISKLRGTWQKYDGIDFMPTYHPSYLLREERDPALTKKREAWSDLQQVMKKLAGG